VLEVGPSLTRDRGEEVLDAAGGEVIPGLHDHHVHLHALIAARWSVDASTAASSDDLDRIVVAAAAASPVTGITATADLVIGQQTPWLRVTGWSEHIGGDLDRWRLDTLVGRVPVRVQHRSGAMWVLNSAALGLVAAEDCDLPGVERDRQGVLTGRLLRMDGWLRDRLAAIGGGEPPNGGLAAGPGVRRGQVSAVPGNWLAIGLADYAAACARLGVTGFTDATPGRDQADVDEFESLSTAGIIPQRLVLMAPPGLHPPGPREPGPSQAASRVTLGPTKVILDDALLPETGQLTAAIAAAHHAGSAVAVHCVTAEQLIIAVAAFERAGPAGDRIEHASVVPPGYPAKLAQLGLTVVTEPGFIGTRGDDYLRDVPAAEQDWLYPCASLVRAGVAVAAGTDAPFGPADPWRCIAGAVTRQTPTLKVLGRNERVSADRAMRLFLGSPEDPARLRVVAAGQPADLCVLHTSVREALARPDHGPVQATIIGGRIFKP
jgi:predicted amidohydrolase YtcJ